MVTTCAATLVGCATADPLRTTRGSAVDAWPTSDAQAVRPAPHSAYYDLWDEGATRVVRAEHAKRNEPIGFRRDDGKLVAVAGWVAVPVDDRHAYTWRLQPGDPVDDNDGAVDAEHRQVVAGAVIVGVGTALGVFALVRLLTWGHL
jgi:hypothetical protein